jgi:hypothetical protein
MVLGDLCPQLDARVPLGARPSREGLGQREPDLLSRGAPSEVGELGLKKPFELLDPSCSGRMHA